MKFVKVHVEAGEMYVNLACVISVSKYGSEGTRARLDLVDVNTAVLINITPAEFFRLPVIHMGE